MDTEAAGTSAIKINLSVRARPISVILAFGLLVRLGAAFLPGFAIDMGTFQGWSMQLADHGPWNFYTPDPFPDWAPGYMYVLWFFGGLNRVFGFGGHAYWYLLKLPSIAADLASAILLYRILEGQKPAVRSAAAALYLLNPVVLLAGPVWGQVDSLLAFFLLFTVYYLARGRTLAAAVVYTIGFLTKPQAVAALPIFLFWGLRQEVNRISPALSASGDLLARAGEFGRNLAARIWPVAAAALAAAFLMDFAFFPSNPFGIVDHLVNSQKLYPFSSFYAFNFWEMFGRFKPDDTTFIGLTHRWWGFLLFGGASLSIIWTFRDAKGPGLLALGTALSVLAFFLFATRMHERYLFPSILLLVAAGAALNARSIWAILGVLTVVDFFNVYYAYINFTDSSHGLTKKDNYLAIGWLWDWIDHQVFLISFVTFLTFPILLAAGFLLAKRERAAGEPAADG